MRTNGRMHDETADSRDAAFLDDAFRYLQARAARIGAERALADQLVLVAARPAAARGASNDQAKALVLDTLEVERRARAEMDGHAERLRGEPRFRLGLDALVERHELDENERLILLSCAAVAIGQRFAETVFAGLGGYFHSPLQVEGAIGLLDPRTVGDLLGARRYFHPEAPLIKGGLVLIEFHAPYRIPSDLFDANVHLSNKALCELTGDMAVNNERWGG